ncbi:MAG: alcohol dehydrogenase catalytic domain-containing protein [Treponemataceae bacterium]
MQALMKIKKGPDGVMLRDIAEPKPEKNEIKIKVHAAGICGTDLHIMKDEYETKPPMVMGHEYSGIVTEVGIDVSSFAIGDRVVSLTTIKTCETCAYCKAGLHMLCETRSAIGTHVNGAFAEYLTVPADKAFKIPKAVSLDEAALCEPLACVVRSVTEKATIKAGDFVFVSGPGTIGNLAFQVARANGANVVVGGIAKDAARLALAAELGAYAVVEVDSPGAEQKMRELTYGLGFDVAFECSGVAASTDTCIAVLKKTGLYVQVGLFGKKILFDNDLVLKKELTITSGFTAITSSWERALRLLEFKQVNLKPLISAKLPLCNWEKGFGMAINKEGYKILLVP